MNALIIITIGAGIMFILTAFMAAWNYTGSQESSRAPEKRLDDRVRSIGLLFWSLIFLAISAYGIIGADILCYIVVALIVLFVTINSAHGVGASLLRMASSFNLDKFVVKIINDAGVDDVRRDDEKVKEEDPYQYDDDEEPLPDLPKEIVEGMDEAIKEVAAKKTETKKKVEEIAGTPEETIS